MTSDLMDASLMASSEDDENECYSLLLADYLKHSESMGTSEMELAESRLVFEITSDDGFFIQASTCEGKGVV
jgi:hypothetical protein